LSVAFSKTVQEVTFLGFNKMADETITRDDTLNIAEELGRARLVALLFCEYGNMAAEGKANVLAVFDTIQAITLNDTTQIAFYLFVRTANTEGPVYLRIFDPGGKIVIGLEFQADKPELLPGQPWCTQVLAPARLPVKVEGTYWAEVSYKGEVLGRAALYVLLPKMR